MTIFAATGHRPDKLFKNNPYSEEAFNKLVLVAETIINYYEPTKLIIGMALGFDIAMAQACVNKNVPFIAAIPFEDQEIKWSYTDKKRYLELCLKAENIVVVSKGGYADWKFQKRNEYMVDNADEVMALWDGSEGGTANCIEYAESKSKVVHNFWKLFENINKEVK